MDEAGAQPIGTRVTSQFYVGKRWKLVAVLRRGDHGVQIPAGVGARIEFLHNGKLRAFDGVNALSGRYHPSADGLITDTGTTLALYGGDDPARRAASAGFETVVLGIDPSSSLSRLSNVAETGSAGGGW